MPQSSVVRHTHHVGSKAKMNEKAISAPTTPPEAAACVLILIKLLTMAHTTCMTSAPPITPNAKRGM